MSKQIKIGFDKVPAPVTKQYPILIDIQGERLTDAAGNFLVTEEEAELASFSRAENSTSTVVNNEGGDDDSVPVVEQFPVESEVSSSILGVPRSETQLSLFSDVATYGLDEDNWNFYVYDASRGSLSEWVNRKNDIYGRRGEPSFNEESKENALYLRSFPVQYTYPRGPLSLQEENPTDTFQRYMKFLAIGKFLYAKYKDFYPLFANKNLIGEDIKLLNADDQEVQVNSSSFIGNGTNSVMKNEDSFFEVSYGSDLQKSMDSIERFTQFWLEIVDGTAVFPLLTGSQGIPDYTQDPQYQDLRIYATDNTRPGGSSSVERFAVLESKQSFRYQPGRISGFTFGIRTKTDPSSSSNFVEWGTSNDTDEYMFQLKGTEFNIIRRSTIPLPTSLLRRMGLEDSDQQLRYNVSLNNSNQLYETVIPRSKWNGDKLDTSGRSGYILTFEDVTMYKIEFSWYGAIGAKFYAYIPTGVGEARWVLMHTLVIENGLGQPILKNPNMKFKYLVYSSETSRLVEPTYIYKYGSSYYIDGGDEGTISLTSDTGETKQFSQRTPLLGVMPKNDILNRDGQEITNDKKIYPQTVSVVSDQNTRIDIEEITGTPDGHHFYYAPCLHNDINEGTRTVNLYFDTDGTTIFTANGDTLEATDDQAKIIASGVYNSYISYEDSETANLLRRKLVGSDFELVDDLAISQKTQKYDGTTFFPRLSTPQIFSARLTKYDTVVASTVPITSNRFRIHFLNPAARDGNGRSYAEFALTVASKEPFIDATANNALRFGTNSDEFDINEFPYVEYSGSAVGFNADNEEYAEIGPVYGLRLGVDYRLPEPEGRDSGVPSSAEVEVSLNTYDVNRVEAQTGEFAGLWKIVFETSFPPVDESSVGTAEVGVNGVGLGIFYSSVPVQDPNDDNRYFVYVDGDPEAASGEDLTQVGVQSKTLTIRNNWQVESVNQQGFNRFAYQLWSYSKVTNFNIQPLYPVFLMRDKAKINNIAIEEITPQTTFSHTPNLITDSTSVSIIDPFSGSAVPSGTASTLPPTNFTSNQRLSGARFDDQNLLPLRPGVTINTFHIQPNKPLKLNLENIFNFDRKALTRGIYNNKAIFFNASSESGGNAEITLTVKEQ